MSKENMEMMYRKFMEAKSQKAAAPVENAEDLVRRIHNMGEEDILTVYLPDKDNGGNI